MNLVFNLFGLLAAAALLAAAFIYIASPGQASRLLRTMGIALAALILGVVLVGEVAAEVPGSGALALGILPLVSLAAYRIRQARTKPVRRRSDLGGAERTPAHFPGEDL